MEAAKIGTADLSHNLPVLPVTSKAELHRHPGPALIMRCRFGPILLDTDDEWFLTNVKSFLMLYNHSKTICAIIQRLFGQNEVITGFDGVRE